ncbi:MAG: Mur ligase family protein [bacterium]|nr:Mur ligase family protein [bacterium]
MINNIFKKIVQFKLKWLAKIYLWRTKPKIIVIAGTTGRYWIKEAVEEALEEKNFSVRTNRKNFNAEIGLPLSILGLPSGNASFFGWLKILWQAHKICLSPRLSASSPRESAYLVLEMVIDAPENMNYLLSIVKPDAVILTTITMIYAENFENLDEIALEYKKLIKVLPWNGLAILNFDDERVKNLAESSDKRVISYGFSKEADFQVKNVRKVSDGQEFEISCPRQSAHLKINRFGQHHIYAELIKAIIKDNFKDRQKDFFGKILK